MLEKAGQHLAVRGVLRAVQGEVIGVYQLGAAHEEHLYGRLGLGPRQPEDVLVRAAGGGDGLALRYPFDRADLVADVGCPLELQLLRCRLHLGAQVAQHLLGAPFQEEDGLADHLGVLLFAAVRGAGGDAAVDVVLQARPRVVAGDRLRAASPGEELLGNIERFSHGAGAGVRAEVAGAVLLHPAGDVDAGPGVAEVYLQVGVVLIVLEPDVVERLMTLHQRRFQVERLLLGVGDDVLEVGDSAAKVAQLRLQAGGRAEVRAHAGAQAGGLADVDHLAAVAAEQVDAGPPGYCFQPFEERLRHRDLMVASRP